MSDAPQVSCPSSGGIRRYFMPLLLLAFAIVLEIKGYRTHDNVTLVLGAAIIGYSLYRMLVRPG